MPCPSNPKNSPSLPPSRKGGVVPVVLNRGEVPVARHGGGQPGNINALKHGFYSKQLKHENLAGLDTSPHTGLTDDIVVLRITIRRLVDLVLNATTPSEIIEATRALYLGYQSLTRMVKTQHLLTSGENPILDALSQALDELSVEMGLE